MDPQILALIIRLAAACPWIVGPVVLVLNIHRVSDAYASFSAARLRNRAARQVLNCELSEAQRDRAAVVVQELGRQSYSRAVVDKRDEAAAPRRNGRGGARRPRAS